MFSKSIGNLTISRLRLFQIVLLTTKPVIWDVLRTWEATIRAKVLPRVIFLEVCRLELRDYIHRMISILRSGCLEISLNSLSCPIFGYLPGIYYQRDTCPTGSFSFTLNVARGLMTSISKISTNACWVSATAKAVSSRPQSRKSKRIPFSRLSLTFSHAALVVDGSARGSNEVSTVFALRWSPRKELTLQ